jgi:hypothetical protein
MVEDSIDATADSTADAVAARVCHRGKHLIHGLLELREVPTAGRGWFALADIPPGTQLWKEKAFTVGRNRADLVKRVGADLERHAAFCRPAHSSGEAEAEGIVSNNFFENGPFTGAMLFELTSMINHSCCPNTSVEMMKSEFGACYSRVTTARAIMAGEQILISYSHEKLFRPRQERPCQTWGFSEPCARCQGSLPPEEQERWDLLEAASVAADLAERQPPRRRTTQVAMTVLPLLVSAEQVVEGWLPNLAEGHRFASLAEVYRLDAPRHSVLDVQWHASDDDDAASWEVAFERHRVRTLAAISVLPSLVARAASGTI